CTSTPPVTGSRRSRSARAVTFTAWPTCSTCWLPSASPGTRCPPPPSCPWWPGSREASEERSLGGVALGERLHRDPDLLDLVFADLEHGGGLPVGSQVPVVETDEERAGELEVLMGEGDGGAGAHAVDVVEGVRGRRPHHP